ncbi:M48 family metalloprotease [Pontivivens nitratireducens]|uniref:M48 family metalloprotease n=1 Tax=Pontivivens nitratireducens TaxID=2758038 RepID=UPI00163B3B8E|nr:M48 family metalloprotease [Pontibrevibacter nitratireducens]
MMNILSKTAAITIAGLSISACTPSIESGPPTLAFGPPGTISLYSDRTNDKGWQVASSRAVESKLEEILQTLLPHVPGASLPGGQVRIHPQISEYYNGSASNTNDIYISVGALHQATSEDEVAFLIAHELAHIALSHNGGGDAFATFDNTIDTMAAIVDSVSQLGVGLDLIEDEDVIAAFGAATFAQMSADAIAGTVHGRRTELAADRLAWDMYSAAGYGADAYPATFSNIASGEIERKTILEQNAANLRAQANAIALSMDENIIREGLRALAQQTAIFAAQDMLLWAAKTHPSPQDREAALFDYIGDDPYQGRSIDDTQWARWKNSSGIAALQRLAEAESEAGTLVSSNRADAAARTLSRLLSGTPHPGGVHALAMSYLAADEQRRMRDTMRRLPEDAVIGLYVAGPWAAEEIRTGNPRFAENIAARVERAYGPDSAQPIRVSSAVLLEDAGQLALALERCETLSSSTVLTCRNIASGRTAPEENESSPLAIFQNLIKGEAATNE